jgi:putative DNA primase/helicase
MPGDDTLLDEAQHEAWLDSLPRTKTGTVKPSEYIAHLAFTQAPQFAGKIAYDLRRRAPIATAKTPAGPKGPWTTAHTMSMAIWLQQYDIAIKPSHIDNALIPVAKANELNPLEAWLYSIEWDGQERIGRWLATYCGAEDTEANSIMGSKWLIGAVARACKPGCRMDYMLVLEGAQGARKSTLVKVLGGEYAGENLPDFHSRDAMQMAGFHWIIEVSELAALRKAEIEHIKAFLSRTEDSYVGKWEKHPASFPRQCVLLGNMNPDGNGYLQDSTGNRRFWPVRVAEIDIPAVKADRDQIWAEAMHCFLRGDHWWLENGEHESVAEQQQLRRAEDPWEEVIVQWCAARIGTFTAIDVATSALQIEPADINRSVSIRIGIALKLLGYERKRIREQNRLTWVYERPE